MSNPPDRRRGEGGSAHHDDRHESAHHDPDARHHLEEHEDDLAPRDVERREAAAVDAATAERRSDGVRVDAHGEYEPDPYPGEQDPGDTAEDVIDQHRRQAERVEHHPAEPESDHRAASTEH